MEKELRSLKNIRDTKGKDSTIDSVKYAMNHSEVRAYDVLMEAKTYWDNMSKYRADRERCKNYNFGRQWDDIIEVDGVKMTEEKYIQSVGNVALKNNLIRRLVRNVTGVYRSQDKEPVCNARDRNEQREAETLSTLLQYNMQTNRMSEMYARTFEEYLIGAFVVHKKWWGWQHGRQDCWTDNVSPIRFFIDTNARDLRGWDVTCLGEIHDVSFGELAGTFAHSPEDYEKLAQIYHAAHMMQNITTFRDTFGSPDNKSIDFLYCRDDSLCRVIEVWRKETKARYRCHDWNSGELFKCEIDDYPEMVEAENERRKEQGLSAGMEEEDIPLIETEWFVDNYWYFYYLSPFGDILAEGETPYAHKSHPYVFKAFPFIDGEIHSFVSDVIDQQRYTNRLITLYDWVIRASAKGVLLVPQDCIPEGMSLEQFASSWTKVNGVVLYKAKQGVPAPEQVAQNSTNVGIADFLQVQLKFFEDISGVHGALQGRQGVSGQSGTLYAQQAQNATTSLLDLLDSFAQFEIDAAYKDVKNIQQFYDTKRVTDIAGSDSQVFDADPEKVLGIECDISITESQASPTYKDNANQILLQFWQAQQISLKQLLEVGKFPFGDELLQRLESDEQQMQQGGQAQGLDPQMQQQLQQQSNPSTVDTIYGAIRGDEGEEEPQNTMQQ